MALTGRSDSCTRANSTFQSSLLRRPPRLPGAYHARLPRPVRVARATPVALQLDCRCTCCLRTYVPNQHLHRLSLTPPCVVCTPSCGSLLARCRSWLRPKSSSCRRGCSHASPGAVVSSTPPRTRPPPKQRMPDQADRRSMPWRVTAQLRCRSAAERLCSPLCLCMHVVASGSRCWIGRVRECVTMDSCLCVCGCKLPLCLWLQLLHYPLTLSPLRAHGA